MSDTTLAPDELRDAFDAVQKENKKLQARNEELLKENRTMKAVSAITEAGLSADLADLFIVANPDAEITTDSVKEFAAKYGIGVAPASESDGTNETQKPAPPTQGLEGFARAGSRTAEGGSAPSGQKVLSRNEFIALQKENPGAAQKALAEGRVQLRNDNPLAEGRQATGVNPFLASREVAET